MVAFMTAMCPKTHSWKKYSFVLLGHPRKASVVAVTPTSYSFFLPPDKGCGAALSCHSMHMASITWPSSTYIHHTTYMVNTFRHGCNDLCVVWNKSHLSHLPTLGGCQAPHDEIHKALRIEIITCIMEASSKYENHKNSNTSLEA